MENELTKLPDNATPFEEILSWISKAMTHNYYLYRDSALNPGVFLTKHGKIYENVQNGIPKCKTGQCYHNAALNMINDYSGKTEYVEGVVCNTKFSCINHGWNLVDGQPVDFTFVPTEFDTYFGVVIPKHLVIKAMSNRQKTRQSEHGVLGTLALYKNSKKFLLELEGGGG